MPAPQSFAAKSPIPIYALALPRADVLLYAGGGGQSRSGIVNAIRSATIEFGSTRITERSEVKLSNQEDAPMCLALSPDEDEEGLRSTAGPSERQILVGVNAPVVPSGENENLRLFEWTSSGTGQAQGKDHGVGPEGKSGTNGSSSAVTKEADVHTLKSIKRAPSISINDAEVYIRCAVASPDGNYLAIGGTDGQLALHAFPSLERLWQTSSGPGGEIIDATFSADSALVAFVTPNAIQIFPTKGSAGNSAPKMYQSIRNPSLKGLGSSKKDRDKAKVRKCFISTWDANNWALIQTRQVSERPATVMEISDDGKYLALSTSDLSIHLLSATTLKTIWRIRDAHAFPGTCLAFSPCGQVLASGSADMSLRLIRLTEIEIASNLTDVLHGRAATVALALLLAFIAWYLQRFLLPKTASTGGNIKIPPSATQFSTFEQ